VRHVFLELLELHPRLLDSLLRLLDSDLGATLLDRVDDQEGKDEHKDREDEHEEYAFNRQLNSSKRHRLREALQLIGGAHLLFQQSSPLAYQPATRLLSRLKT